MIEEFEKKKAILRTRPDVDEYIRQFLSEPVASSYVANAPR